MMLNRDQVKYDLAPVLYGEESRHALQHWVADMDFACCPKIRGWVVNQVFRPWNPFHTNVR